MKEFLKHLYIVVSSDGDGVHELFDVIPDLANDKKFDSINQIITDVDLSKLDTGTMYSMVFLTSGYIKLLSEYKNFYRRVREEFARRGEPSARINELFDRWEDGGGKDRLYNPDRPVYKSYTKEFEERLDRKIELARQLNDKELEDILIDRKSSFLKSQEGQEEFHKLRKTLGDDLLKERTVEALREMADLLDKGSSSWPGIYFCQLPEKSPEKSLMSGITVIVSYPWGG